MPRILKTALLLIAMIPLTGSTTCELKSSSGSGTNPRGGIAVCNPPSPTCGTGTEIETTTGTETGTAPILITDDSDSPTTVLLSSSSDTRTAIAQSFAMQPPALPGALSASELPYPAGEPTIPEPGSALLYVIGTAVLLRRLHLRNLAAANKVA